jgi:hypothetical protein
MSYAVVSCHVERPLDDAIWRAFETLLRRRPAGFVVTPFVRPPAAGENESVWLERVRHIAALAPLGHHTHWGGVEQARPKGVDAPALVREQIEWLRANGLSPRYFCGGGWYLDEPLAETLAELGYVDCSATTFQLSYLDEDAPRLQLDGPRRMRLGNGATLLELPATHSLGMLGRGLPRLRGPVHVHFHDWELVERPRAAALAVVLRALRAVRAPIDLDELARRAAAAPEMPFSGVTIAP